MAWLSGWTYRKKLVIDQTKVDGTLSDFPVLIKLSTSTGLTSADVSDIFDTLGADSLKIAVTAADGTTQCYVEVERWDNANELAWLWVKVPSISSSVDTDLYLYFDHAQSDNTTYIGAAGSTVAQSVWDSNTMAAYTFGQDPQGGAGCIIDDTANNNDGTAVGEMLTGDLVDGNIGKALDFEGANDGIEITDSASLTLGGNFTISTIIKPHNLPSIDGTIQSLVCKFDTDGGYDIRIIHYSGTLNIGVYTNAATTGGGLVTLSPELSNDAWAHIHAVCDGTNSKVYINGEYINQVSNTIVPANGVKKLNIGKFGLYSGSELGRYFDGLIDTVRLHNTDRSAAWIKADYNSCFNSLVTFNTTEDVFSSDTFSLSWHDAEEKLISISWHDGYNIDEYIFSWDDSEELKYSLSWKDGYNQTIYSFLWNDLATLVPIKAELIELYGASAFKKELKEVYSTISSKIKIALYERYAYQSKIKKALEEIYSLLDYTTVKVSTQERYVLNIEDAEITQNTFSVKISNALVSDYVLDVESFSISGDEDSYCLAATCTIANPAQYRFCLPESDIVFKILNDEYCFVVDSRKRAMSFGVTVCTIECRSKTKVLDTSPIALQEYVFSTSGVKSLIDAIVGLYGITADTSALTDWIISASILTTENKTGLSFLSEIAAAAGAILQTDAAGDLIVRYKYPVSPTIYATQTPALILSDINDILQIDEQFEYKQRYNKVLVSNAAVIVEPQDYLIIEMDETRNAGRSVFGASDKEIYLRVYSSTEDYSFSLSSGSVTLVKTGEILELPAETLSFIGLENASLSKPANEIISSVWYGANLGTISIVENSDQLISAADVTEVTLGIASVIYTVKYDVWKLVPPVYTTTVYNILALAQQEAA